MSETWSSVNLGQILQPASRPEAVDAHKEYSLLGVRLDGKGPFIREKINGAQSSAITLFRVASGDFIYSRLFAWRGAFGIIPPEYDGCYVSGEFPTYRAVHNLVDLKFLNYWFQLPKTLNKVSEDCSGSTPLTRNRFKEQFFLRLEIMLPSLEEQRRIVARIEELASRANEIHSNAPNNEMDSLLLSCYQKITDNVQLRKMSDVAPLVRRPYFPKLEENVTEIGIRSFGKGTFQKPPVTGADIGSKRVFYIKSGDLLFSNVFAWEGAIAVARPEDDGLIGSHRFMTCVPKEGVVHPEYLCYHFLTKAGLEDIGEASPGGAGRNRTLGVNKLAAIEVPVPPYEQQLWFCSIKSKIDEMKQLVTGRLNDLDTLINVVANQALQGVH